MCDEIINAAACVSKNESVNVMSTVSTNFHKKVKYKMDCYMLHSVLLVIILLFTITIICNYYAKRRSKPKKILPRRIMNLNKCSR